MKKLLALLLALALCLSIAGCGSEKSEESTTTSETEAVETEPTETEPTETEPTETEPTETEPTETEPTETEPTETEPTETDTTEIGGSTPLLYKVTSGDSVVWLFGSIHLASDEMYPLPDYVMDAYSESAALAVEADAIAVESDMEALQNILQSVMYLDGTTIADYIDPELYDAAVEIFEENNSYSIFLDYYMPSMWYSMIETFAYINLGLEEESGIDRYLLTCAKDEGKTILEIESMAGHYQMLASFSPELQELLLAQAVNGYDDPTMTEQLEQLVECWCSGDVDSLTELLLSDSEPVDEEQQPLVEEYEKAMIIDRNILMADYAAAALQSDNPIFICVGLAHIIGEGGMVDLLTQRGYTVEQVR